MLNDFLHTPMFLLLTLITAFAGGLLICLVSAAKSLSEIKEIYKNSKKK
jgi:hypothetical protein